MLRTRRRKSGLVTRNMRAIGTLLAQSPKMAAFLRAMKQYYNLLFRRAAAMNRALREGTIDEASYLDFLGRLQGRTAQDQHERDTAQEVRELVGDALTPEEMERAALDNPDALAAPQEATADMPFSLGPEELARILDSQYLAAVERGDMETAQKLVNDAALASGYISTSEHRMQHRAPNSEDDVNLVNLRDSGLVPDDYWDCPRMYVSDQRELAAHHSITDLLRRMDARKAAGKDPGFAVIHVYRAVPKDVKEESVRNGDWVTPSKSYAQDEGNLIPGGYKIITQRALAKDLWWDGNSAAELGYDDGSGYAYRNTKHNRKLLDAVTRDDDGAVIPLTKRFDIQKNDVRFSLGPEGLADAVAETSAQERAEILKNAARDSQGRLLAPNGQPTKLTDDQWTAVRTKAFKERYGDWETLSKKRRLIAMPAIKVESGAALTKAQAKTAYRGLSGVVLPGGQPLQIVNGVFGKLAGHRDHESIFRLIPKFREFLKTSILIYTEKEANPSPQSAIDRFDNYVAKALLSDGRKYFVRFTVQVAKVERHQLHNAALTEIEITEADAQRPSSLSTLATSDSISLDQKLVDWWRSVKPESVKVGLDAGRLAGGVMEKAGLLE